MLFFALSISISIHAPTRGATVTIYGVRVVEGKFQSTLPRGERRYSYSFATPPTNISIHAPTRGATADYEKRMAANRFQSTLPRGERQSHPFLLSSSFSYFNPRSHEGSDSDLVMNIYNRNHFNPRSHEGSDLLHL